MLPPIVVTSSSSSTSTTTSGSTTSTTLSSTSAPTTVTSCPVTATQILLDYQHDTQPLHTQLTSASTSVAKKRKISETLGEEAAICANSLREKKKKTQKDYQIFDGRDVFDLVTEDPITGEVEIKEAKGGKSQYGTRKGLSGTKSVKQCTLPYVETVAHKMSNTNYKGRHSRAPCAAHNPKAVPTCKDCQLAERMRRRKIGQQIRKASASGKLRKTGIRGDYNKSGVKPPEVLTSWRSTTTGGTIPV